MGRAGNHDGSEDHQDGTDGAEDQQGGTDDHHSRANGFEDSYGEADDHGGADLTITKSTERLTADSVAVTG